jgi:hypothetical protein
MALPTPLEEGSAGHCIRLSKGPCDIGRMGTNPEPHISPSDAVLGGCIPLFSLEE